MSFLRQPAGLPGRKAEMFTRTGNLKGAKWAPAILDATSSSKPLSNYILIVDIWIKMIIQISITINKYNFEVALTFEHFLWLVFQKTIHSNLLELEILAQTPFWNRSLSEKNPSLRAMGWEQLRCHVENSFFFLLQILIFWVQKTANNH